MSIARVSSGQQLKNLFKQIYRIQTFAAQEGLKLIDEKTWWMIKSAFYSRCKRERDEISEIEGILTTPPFNPNRPFYKPHYKILEVLKIKMGQYPNAAFLFESLDRAIRPDDYSFDDKDAPLTEGEILEFHYVTLPYPVILLCPPPPDATSKWANKMGAYYKICNEGFEDSKHFQDYKLFLNYCKRHNLFSYKRVDRKARCELLKDKVIRRFEFYLKFRKDLKHKVMYELIHLKYPEVPISTIKYWYQEYLKKQQ